MTLILGRTREEWLKSYPLIEDMTSYKEIFWDNQKALAWDQVEDLPVSLEEIREAEERLLRFRPFLLKHFPELEASQGIIESPLVPIEAMGENLASPARLLLKLDSQLPVAGSIKARGGIYEVLKHTEDLALERGLISLEDDYSKLYDEDHREIFSNYTIQVGSTGNLGLSIGIISATIGYKVIVHMSHDAEEWKKDLLREKGVEVVEYSSDYSKAVEEGRRLSDQDPRSYFVDDEKSMDLFLGYAVAALRLEAQLEAMGIEVGEEAPLLVYLPCGVGGGPGGIAYGLKLIYGDHVHCYFVEPTHSPCMLLGIYTGQHGQVSVQDFGMDNITIADGLAVGRASDFVSRTMAQQLAGLITVDDARLYGYLRDLVDLEDIYLEPSACAGFRGVELDKSLLGLENATEIVWATGGSLVPEAIREKHYRLGGQ